MRHVLFAVVLVGASFLGGAFVNGPGLKWLQAKVLGHAGLAEEVPSLTLPPAIVSENDDDSAPSGKTKTPPTPATAEKAPTSSKPSSKISGSSSPKIAAVDGKRPGPASTKSDPGAPRPEPESAAEGKSGLGNMLGSLLSLGDAAETAQSAPPTSSTPSSKEAKPAEAPRARPTLVAAKDPSKAAMNAPASRGTKPAGPASPAVAANSPGPIPIPEPEPQGFGRPAPLDPSVTPAYLASLGSTPGSGSSSASPSARVPIVQASASSEPRPLPLPLPIPREEATIGGPSTPTATTPGADEWGTIRQKLRTLGVTRYTIEGEPGGRVSFSCLIPLAGRQAVTQRFEAEGDDEIRAARAALRRISLWQATERDRPAR